MDGGLDLVNDFVWIVRGLFVGGLFGVVSAFLGIVGSFFVGGLDGILFGDCLVGRTVVRIETRVGLVGVGRRLGIGLVVGLVVSGRRDCDDVVAFAPASSSATATAAPAKVAANTPAANTLALNHATIR